MANAENEKSAGSPDSHGSGPDDPNLPSSVPLAASSEDRPSSPDDGMSPSKSKDRDPTKPKRKKARRACAACQRAHLTCSDERPCERCIKRNLADQCQDGTRKKAKYLHDAPNEALMPGHAARYKHENGTMVPAEQSQATDNNNASQYQAQPLPLQSMPVPKLEEYKQQYSPASSAFESQQPSPLHSMPPRLQHANSSPQSLTQQATQQPYAPQYLDSGGDPTGLFNFDIPSMNFGNHHGALEFGMLGNMGQVGQSPQFPYDQPQSFQDNRADYSMGSVDSAWASKHLPMNAFDPTMASNNMDWRRNSQTTFPHAFAIGTGSNGFAGQSPASSIEMWQGDFATAQPDGPMSAPRPQQPPRPQATPPSAHRPHSNPQPSRKSVTPSLEPSNSAAVNGLHEPSQTLSKKLGGRLKAHPVFERRRQRDPSFIYQNVKDPYPYTQAFHALTAVISRRFPARKRVRIAKALASIRPSFISLNRNLTDPDLIFMEQNFQRCIWDYEEDANACGTPTLIIRRTGEVAYADKEFSLLSGWTKEVLYGRTPNRNTNKAAQDAKTPGAGSGTNTVNSSRGGYNTPRLSAIDGLPQGEDTSSDVQQQTQAQQTSSGKPRPQPVFLAELLDDDSVVDFYEEYSQRAFGDSRGTTSRRCKLLKYKPPIADAVEELQHEQKLNGHRNGDNNRRRSSHPDDRALVSSVNGGEVGRRSRPGISSEEGMKRLGDEKGVVDCMYCWMVKQDCFNIPMLIVINFLPIL